MKLGRIRLSPLSRGFAMLLAGLVIGLVLPTLAPSTQACENAGVTTAWKMHIEETENVPGAEFSMHLDINVGQKGVHRLRRVEFLSGENVALFGGQLPPQVVDLTKDHKDGSDGLQYPIEPIKLHEPSTLTYRVVTDCGQQENTLNFTTDRYISQTYECEAVVSNPRGEPFLDNQGNEVKRRIRAHFYDKEILSEAERHRRFCWVVEHWNWKP